jgi:hypothetical protein
MLILYVVLVLIGAAVTAAVARRGRTFGIAGVVGTLLAMLAILTGFSIGPLVAIAAVGVISFAAMGLRQPAKRSNG